MTHLRHSPVRRHGSPHYPDRLEVVADPELLKRHMPLAWLSNRELGAAAGVLLGGAGLIVSSGCAGSGNPVTLGIAVPPALLSEADALQIIRTELSARGVQQTAENVNLPDIRLVDSTGAAAPFVADLGDAGGKWAIEYLSTSDLFNYQIPEDGWLAVTGARVEAEVAMQVPAGHVGVFYTDPGAGGDYQQNAAQARAHLQQQVREFLDWLAAQGAL